MYNLQQQASAAIGFGVFINIVFLVLAIWGVIWAYNWMRRSEEREDAKLRALQDIARALRKGEGGSTTREEPSMPKW